MERRPVLRLIRADGGVPHRDWPRCARLLPAAVHRYPTLGRGWLAVLHVTPCDELWLPTSDGRARLVRRCDCETSTTLRACLAVSDGSGSQR